MNLIDFFEIGVQILLKKRILDFYVVEDIKPYGESFEAIRSDSNMMFVIILVKYFIGFKAEQLFLAYSNYSDLFFVIRLIICSVEVWVVHGCKWSFVEFVFVSIFPIIPYLSLSLEYEEKLLDEISLVIHKLVISKSSDGAIR